MSRSNTFVNQSRYEFNTKDLYSDCGYDYFETLLRAEYYSLLESAECRKPSRDVVGTLAGAWFSSLYGENPRGLSQGMALAIAGRPDGGVDIGGIGFSLLVQGSDPTGVPPETITTSHCYEGLYGRWGGPQGFVYLEVRDSESLAVSHGKGFCPPKFPTDYSLYYR